MPPGMLFRSRITTLMLTMFATMASVYVAGRLWQDAENRVYLINEIDKMTGMGEHAISVDDTLKVLSCRDQHKRLAALEMELAGAKHDGFSSKHTLEGNGTHYKKRPLAFIGIFTGFGGKKKRDAIRKQWFPTKMALKKLEKDKGIIVRFVIGISSNHADIMDRAIHEENRQTEDFIILDNHVEAQEDLSKKAKMFLSYAADTWDTEFYVKTNDKFIINIVSFEDMLQTYMDKPRVYIGCMKSGEVFSEQNHKWYEPDWWKFGDSKSYFRHASGEVYVISRALAQFISINRSILRTYAHDDVSVGSWFIGLDVKHVDEGKLCCSSWSGAICKAI
ncbi:Glycosyltransferase, family GT31 [Zostera marina]|uniref:Hexosyltransferase n=1 Tax=Zostera marina TaxID=29655 RepID=A0A0K9NK41_ZOSMR|nr:Glycosyltransferase, family GT31 [Zostera marina]